MIPQIQPCQNMLQLLPFSTTLTILVAQDLLLLFLMSFSSHMCRYLASLLISWVAFLIRRLFTLMGVRITVFGSRNPYTLLIAAAPRSISECVLLFCASESVPVLISPAAQIHPSSPFAMNRLPQIGQFFQVIEVLQCPIAF